MIILKRSCDNKSTIGIMQKSNIYGQPKHVNI